jgi:molecular chaperone GrpE
VKFAAENIIEDLVPVLDSFDLALEHEMPKDVERGVILIRSQLEDVLRRRGVEIIRAKGEQFDPGRHESVGEIESDGPEGVVIEELQRGYLLHGKVLRPARVKISRVK